MKKKINIKEMKKQIEEVLLTKIKFIGDEEQIYFGTPDTLMNDLVAKLSLYQNSLLDELLSEVENAQFELTPLEESIRAGWSELDANRIEAKGQGYNQALEDVRAIINHKKI